MQRKLLLVGAIAVAVALVAWKLFGGSPSREAPRSPAGSSTPVEQAVVRGERRPDPKSIATASIAGTVTSEREEPIAKAQVCASGVSPHLPTELLREPRCTTTDDHGRYQLDQLLPALYHVMAAAKPYRPGRYEVDPKRRHARLDITVGDKRAGIDIALRDGGVEVTGVVSDLTGGPVIGARVVADAGWDGGGGSMAVETDAAGRYSVWVAPGFVELSADADGYTTGLASGTAPGTVDVFLTPESQLSGRVVDAGSRQPIEGARVFVASAELGSGLPDHYTFTNASGEFRASKLSPGRHIVVATTANGYGRSEGSTLVGLAQHVDGVVVAVHPAARVSGTVLTPSKQPCASGDAFVSLSDQRLDRWVRLVPEPDGVLRASGVMPGAYRVNVECKGFVARAPYRIVEVSTADVDNLVWEVDAGSAIRGKVVSASGAPVEAASIWASPVNAERDVYVDTKTDRNGAYELLGLVPGTYKLEVKSDRGVGPRDGFRVGVPSSGDVTEDLVLEDGGTIAGVVVDAEGRPAPRIDVVAGSLDGDAHKSATTDGSGAFALASLPPGAYRVRAHRGYFQTLRKPGTTDDARQGERATVRIGQTTNVRLVIETQTGVIEGTVVDTAGKPISDAFVSAARESNAAGALGSSIVQTRWSFLERPVLTNVDGAFEIGTLEPGNYTLRAYRRGGGEAIVEHVPVGTKTQLQIKAVGSIAGTVTVAGTAAPPDEISLHVRDVATGFRRRELFYKTAGSFVVRDLPKGTFQLSVTAASGEAQLDIALAEGETKTGVTIALEAPITLTGRLVALGSQRPVSGIAMTAHAARGGRPSGGDDDRAHISDASGRFTIENAPRGQVMLRGWPTSDDNEYGSVTAFRSVAGTGTVDVGEVPVLKRRVKPGATVGDLGVNFAEQPRDTPPEQREYKVSWIDPAGPAAKTELKVGDIVATIDGIEVGGIHVGIGRSLLAAPPGTKLALGLARGVTVHVILAAP